MTTQKPTEGMKIVSIPRVPTPLTSLVNGDQKNGVPMSEQQPTHSGLPLVARIELEKFGSKYSGKLPLGYGMTDLLVVEPKGDSYVGFLVRSPWGVEGYSTLNGDMVAFRYYSIPEGATGFTVEITERKK